MKQFAILMLLLVGTGSFAATITVNADGTGDYATIQAAIDAADPNENDVVILTPGTYTGDGNRDIDFFGKAITVQSIDPTDPNIVANTVIDCQGSEADPHRAFNFITGEGQTSILDGLTIKNGYNASLGGGIYIDSPGPVIQNCAFENNYATYSGSAIKVTSGDVIRISNCIITNNHASDSAIYSGAVSISNANEAYVADCIFVDNDAGMYINNLSSVEISKCFFMDNNLGLHIRSDAIIEGSTFISNYNSGIDSLGNINVQSCLFSRNGLAGIRGAGEITATNCTFNMNNTRNEWNCGGIYNGGDLTNYIENCIFWENNSNDIGWPGCCYKVPPTIVTYASFSILQPGWDEPKSYSQIQGTNIITEDPQFFGAANDDCHILPTSPAIDAGDPNYVPSGLDIDGQPRLMGPRVDMGADEWFVDGLYININPMQLIFNVAYGQSNPAPQYFEVRAFGDETLNWFITEDCPWLTVEPLFGANVYGAEPNEVEVSVDISGLTPGQYDYTLAVTDPNADNTGTVDVSLHVQGPIIQTSTSSLSFSALLDDPNPPDQTFTISNSGLSTLNWQITETCPWLSVSPTSGSVSTDSNTVTVSVDIAGLAGENYNCDLTITDPLAENNPQTVSVNLSITPPIFDLSTSAMNFSALLDGPNPADQTLTITNIGGGILNWQIDEMCSWLTVSPASGSCAPGVPQDVAVSVDITGLVEGSYNCDLLITDPLAENSPQTVSVNLSITPPIIDLSSHTMNFSALLDGPNPANQILMITNTGGGTLNWQIDETCSWLSASPASGSCVSGVSEDVTVAVDISTLPADVYNCELTITDPLAENNPQTVNVYLSLQGPILSVSSTIFYFAVDFGGPNPNNQILTISNPGGGTLNWLADTTGIPSWLTISDPMEGNLNHGESDSITLSVDLSGLSQGLYSYAFEVADSNASDSPKSIQVNLEYGTCYTGPDFTEWIAVGRPESWCTPYQCHGDADNAVDMIGKCYRRIGYGDIDILLDGFNKAYSGDPLIDPWISADFDHAAEIIAKQSRRVGYNDINILLSWFNTADVPADCQTASPVSP